MSTRTPGLHLDLSALAHRPFAWYFAARTVSSAGTVLVPVALTFAVLGLGDGSGGASGGPAGGTAQGAADLALVLATRTIAVVVFVLFGGVVADRFSRIMVLQVAHVLTALTQGVAAWLVLTGSAHVWQLAGIEALNGAASAFTMPAMIGILPSVVPPGRIQPANALLSFSRNLLNVLGPAFSGLLVAGAGAGWALAADSVTYVLAVVLLSRVRVVPAAIADGLPGVVTAGASSGMWGQLRDGWSEFASRTWLWFVVAVFCVINAIVAGAMGVLGPVVASRHPSLGATGWGLGLAAGAAGTVVCALVLTRVHLRRPLVVGVIGTVAFALPIACLGVWPQTLPFVVACVIGNIGVEIFSVGWLSALQEHIPQRVLSRVASYDQLGSYIAMPIGTLVYGWLAGAADLQALLLWSAGVYVVVTLIGLAPRSVRKLRSVPPAGPTGTAGPRGAGPPASSPTGSG